MSIYIALATQPELAAATLECLYTLGVSPAKPSRREHLSPAEINAIILKTLHRRESSVGQAVDDFAVDRLGTELATDLMLANLDNPSWAWCQTLDVHTPAFWQRFDSTTCFVLAFSAPAEHLAQSLGLHSEVQADSLQHLVTASLEEWVANHAALLTAYYSLGAQAVLVHRSQLARPEALALELGLIATTFQEEGHEDEQKKTIALQLTLLQQVASQYPQAMALWAEMQAVAQLPCPEPKQSTFSPLDTWHVLSTCERATRIQVLAFQTTLANQSGELAEAAREREALLGQLHQVQQEYETAIRRHEVRDQEVADVRGELSASREQADMLKAKLAEQSGELAEVEREREALLGQLHQVQQEYETAIRRHEARDQEIADVRGELSASREQADMLEAKLAEQSGELAEVEREREALLGQLHQVQEELELYFLRYQKSVDYQQRLSTLQLIVDFWHDHAPRELWIDTRRSLNGNGWHEAEANGRWTGPENVATLQLPPLAKGSYTVQLHLVDAIQPEVIAGLNMTAVFAEGVTKNIDLVHDFYFSSGLYPMVCIGILNMPTTTKIWQLRLQVPYTKQITALGGEDSRYLGLYVSGINFSDNLVDATEKLGDM